MRKKTRRAARRSGAPKRPSRLPVFRNVCEIRATPRVPVIPYFTAKQWKAATRGVTVRARAKLDPSHVAVRFHPAPWGGGDIVTYHDLELPVRIGVNCVPVLRLGRIPGDPHPVLRFGYELCVPEPSRPVGSCELIIHPFVGPIPDDVSPWSCEQGSCTGRCELVLVGEPADGVLQCQCKSSVRGVGVSPES